MQTCLRAVAARFSAGLGRPPCSAGRLPRGLSVAPRDFATFPVKGSFQVRPAQDLFQALPLTRAEILKLDGKLEPGNLEEQQLHVNDTSTKTISLDVSDATKARAALNQLQKIVLAAEEEEARKEQLSVAKEKYLPRIAILEEMVQEMTANLERPETENDEAVPPEVVVDASPAHSKNTMARSPSTKAIPPTEKDEAVPPEVVVHATPAHSKNTTACSPSTKATEKNEAVPPEVVVDATPAYSKNTTARSRSIKAIPSTSPTGARPHEQNGHDWRWKSVCLYDLPPFVTPSHLSRISRRKGLPTSAIMGCSFWMSQRSMGAWLHFRSEEHARQFAARPLLLEVRRPLTGQPEVDVFPPADAVTTLSDLQELYARTPPWNSEHLTDTTPLPTMVYSVQTKQLYHRAAGEPILPTAARWLSLRVPGPGIPVFTPPGYEAADVLPEAQTEADSEPDYDESASAYPRALRMALNRERELEAALQRQATEAQEGARALARIKAEAQIRADFGAFGALEDVWIREVPVRKKTQAGEEVSTYELHALVAYTEARMAQRAQLVLPVQVPVYAKSRLRFALTPWPETMEPRVRSIADGTAVEGAENDGAREGWARRLEREHRVQTLMREREKERERQRGVAEGTWGKERLSEIRERIRRMQRRGEREMARQVEEGEPRVKSAKKRKKERERKWKEGRENREAEKRQELVDVVLSSTAAVSAIDSNSPADSTSSSSDSDSDSETDTESSFVAKPIPRADTGTTISSSTSSGSDSDTDSSSSSDSESDFEFHSAAVEKSVEPVTQNLLSLLSGVPKLNPFVYVDSIPDAARNREVGVGFGPMEELLPEAGVDPELFYSPSETEVQEEWLFADASADRVLEALEMKDTAPNFLAAEPVEVLEPHPLFESQEAEPREEILPLADAGADTVLEPSETTEGTVPEPLETIEDTVPEVERDAGADPSLLRTTADPGNGEETEVGAETVEDTVPEAELDAGADPSFLDTAADPGADLAVAMETSGTGVGEQEAKAEDSEVEVKTEVAMEEAKELKDGAIPPV